MPDPRGASFLITLYCFLLLPSWFLVSCQIQPHYFHRGQKPGFS